MNGFDPLGFKATNWRAVGISLLIMVACLVLIVSLVIVFSTIEMNPSGYAKSWRIGAKVFFILLGVFGIIGYIWHHITFSRNMGDEAERVVGEFRKLGSEDKTDQTESKSNSQNR